jgi:hypothetical protein
MMPMVSSSWSVRAVLVAGLGVVAPLTAQQSPRAAPAATGQPAATDVSDSTYLRLHWAMVTDTQVSAEPTEAGRLLAPADWTFDGHAQWDTTSHCISNLVKVTGLAKSPDGLSAFELFTPFSWQWFDDSTIRQIERRSAPTRAPFICPILEIVSPMDFIRRAILPRYRPGAREIGAEPMPKLAASAQSQLQTAYAVPLRGHQYSSVRADAGRVKIAYEIDGHHVEEWIMATIEVIAFSPSIARPKQTGYAKSWYIVTASHVYAYRAPAGTFDSELTLFATIVNSIRPNPNWISARDRALDLMLHRYDEIPGRRRIAVLAEGKHTDTIPAEGQDVSGAPSHNFDEFAVATHGLASYLDPATHARIDLDAASPHPWTNGTGDYLLSANPNFDPARVSGGPWVPLVPEHR